MAGCLPSHCLIALLSTLTYPLPLSLRHRGASGTQFVGCVYPQPSRDSGGVWGKLHCGRSLRLAPRWGGSNCRTGGKKIRGIYVYTYVMLLDGDTKLHVFCHLFTVLGIITWPSWIYSGISWREIAPAARK